ncbi:MULTISPECIES: adenine deaminase C-terminal domain-containing protein [unclassified Bacillus (in: firmicutes)]|uniref:adenine deaminase C-terminal domain-containing protein n=1 Tax=unclassified Bacillus (in: firmicutes) TaxID=185979 RepID=UPI0008E39167|nr:MULTISPECIES: adenine deaminase C-terminal domain-containing protein [unclassified Bacillus (in: firmicutes)]SFB23571.1 adenine deaminase [Bacillus sp. UNCCL13]SFQ87832.1 adenine deaminase [Bacillus sp. cl95]
MPEQRYRWKNKQLREHVEVLDGKKSPTLLLKNARYLNQSLKRWMQANIWIYEDRIVYVGDQLPKKLNDCEVVDCEGQTLVPGYIEPHSHPFQLYNPLTFATYASQFGTTTFINDNMALILQLSQKETFSLIHELNSLPVTMYWWCRFDAQTEIQNEEAIFSNANIKAWLEHDCVLQGGELTGWPKLLAGDDMMLHWMQETKRLRKQIEGHFPGASEKTLAKMMLLGADCDHEAMTGQDVLNRLMQGYMVSLRYSSIRPDLPNLLDEMNELGIDVYDKLIFTTDGSSAGFYEQGVIDAMIRIAMEKGVPTIDAYNMATINVARYYHMEHLLGNIATGRIANINFLSDENNPTPVSVLSKGKWLKRNGENTNVFPDIDWSKYGLGEMELNWNLSMDDLQFSMPFGMKMENAVITKPYSISIDVSDDELSENHDESFFMLIDRNGKWRINTVIKGFANKLSGMASSFSNTGDIILIGKRKSDMMLAFNRMKEMGGGIVVTENNEVLHEISLSLNGVMSHSNVVEIISDEKKLLAILSERGYHFSDPIYSLLFFSSTHLPYIRITQQGMYDVLNKMILFPSIMR